MASVFFVRHQASGIMHEFPFADAPTDKQLAAVAKLCFQRHGAIHAKTETAYWMTVIEVPLLDAKSVPDVPEQGLSVANEAGVAKMTVEATGRVENPK